MTNRKSVVKRIRKLGVDIRLPRSDSSDYQKEYMKVYRNRPLQRVLKEWDREWNQWDREYKQIEKKFKNRVKNALRM